MRETLVNLPRRTKQAIVAGTDTALLIVSFWVALQLRFGTVLVPSGDQVIFALISPLIALPIFARLGLYRAVFRYISVHMGWAILKAIVLFSIVLGLIHVLIDAEGVPRSALIIHSGLAFVLVSGSRVLSRWWFSERGLHHRTGGERLRRHRAVIYGAGEAGVQLAAALGHTKEVLLVGFVDDDQNLHGRVVRGLTVFNPANLEDLVEQNEADQLLLAMPSAPRSRKKEIVDALEGLDVEVLTLPGVADLARGRVQLSDLRPVSITDILGRDPVAPDEALLDSDVAGNVVMVTGAGGSIGSELCRQILKRRPHRLVIFERSEYALYTVERELSGLISDEKLDSELVAVLGSVNQGALLESLMRRHAVDTVYHAAAYKHVPLVEANPSQGVYNNIFGTWRAARAAADAGVARFVLISTDKAVRPTNVMGATKRFAEMIVQCMDHKSETVMCMVRFGNVLGSSGSVVPLFQKQIEGGGPVTVTHPDVTRYFMTIPEAAQLVIQAGAMATGGDVFVLDMGKPIRIVDLARRMIKLSGYSLKDESNPNGDIEIRFSGLRPGEKLYEELLIGDNTYETDHALILRAREYHLTESELTSILDRIKQGMEDGDTELIKTLLQEAVSEYSVAS